MRSVNRRAAFIGCLALAIALIAPPFIRGDEWNLATKFTINHDFEVPNMVLQANTPYVIRILDSPSNRNVVQIFNEDQSRMLTMFIAISALRPEVTDDTQFTFMETLPQYPLPIKEWFYPGRLSGLEFVYPKEQAAKIALHMRGAAVTETAANITKSEPTAELEKPSVEENVTPVEPQVEVNQEQKVEQEVENVDRSAEIAQNNESVKTDTEVQQEKPSEPEAVNAEEQELPRTAGELPIIAFIGVLCLGTGLGLKVLSAKS